MNTTTKVIVAALIGLVVGVGGTATFSRGDKDTGREDVQHEMANRQMMGGNSMGMQDEMGAMNGMLQGKTGDAFDKAFLSEMIAHHQGAVVMAQEALKNAKHQEIKDLAQDIITAQNKEITEMKAWQMAWYGSEKPSSSR
ncbi:MAG: hypothetical protein AB203_00680 [Parcubacteria bacterium C7867-008]|nr:MAG: hypothetical protein AB203_00680 [Parcubacteria bacterium C7867-008]